MQSAFSIKLREHNVNFYSLFVPDFMHEFELGVWKSVFTHLMRILHATGEDSIQVFNQRSVHLGAISDTTTSLTSAHLVSDRSQRLAGLPFVSFRTMSQIKGSSPRVTTKIVFRCASCCLCRVSLSQLTQHAQSVLYAGH